MKKRFHLLLISGLTNLCSFAQQVDKREKYDVTKDKVLYTIGYAHLDTQWNWDYPLVINQYIKNTLQDNFKLLEKYPDYVFNFTGSRRYNFMKEYYPADYKKLTEYIQQGRWFISGSSVDEAEVNISSSESVLRHVLYGNLFFKREFNKPSRDYMLPDCFGFVATLPSVLNHAGLIGFSTQKLTWGSANGTPFNVGTWEGPDGKSITAALNGTSYAGHIVEHLDKDSAWSARMESNVKKYNVPIDFRYYGTGDVGGAPQERDVQNAMGSIKQADNKFKVILTSSDQIFKDIDANPTLKAKLPSYSGDLLLTQHSAGSMTSESYMKRANRKNELLAKSAEMLASTVDWLGGAAYPTNKLNRSWDLVLGSQMHDMLPGTAIPRAYMYSWNDEFIAMNGFSEVIKNSVSAIAHQMNTQVQGKAVVVYNPVAMDREDVVTAELTYAKPIRDVQVLDKNGNMVPSQVVAAKDGKLTVIFLAKLPSAALAVYDAVESKEKAAASTLMVDNQTLENSYFKVKLNANGDIASIYDKIALREVLSKPATLQFLKENPSEWPAWNMDWKDRKNPPIDSLSKEATIKVVENGPVRVALEVTKKGLNSEIIQIISLSAGEAGRRIEVKNKLDWQSKEVSLKAAFPTTVNNEFATYGMSTAAIPRTTNNEVKYEVPGRQWFDITDRSNSYGVSILEDCKYGSDKPDNSTVRLTLMYTPKANSYVYQGTQDWGIHDIKYAIYPHAGDWAYAHAPWQGSFVNNPLIGFETTKHNGSLGKEISLVKLSTHQVDITAFKKAEESDYYIVRFNELYGKSAGDVIANFPGKITDAYEVNGQEQRVGAADFKTGSLRFDMTKFLIRSFAVKFEKAALPVSQLAQEMVTLPFNEDAISTDANRADGNMDSSRTLPAELLPVEMVNEDIRFKTGSTVDGAKNVVAAKSQKINLPAGNFNKLYILAAATEDTKGVMKLGTQSVDLNVQAWTGIIGQHYNRKLYLNDQKVADITPAFVKRDNIAWYANHRHAPGGNEAYQYSYLYQYEISLSKGVTSITLPNNDKIKIFAITVANKTNEDVMPLQPLYDDFKDNKPVQLRTKEYVTIDLQPMKAVQRPLFISERIESADPRALARLKTYLQSLKMDTVIVKTLPSTTDYADVNSGNKVSAAYYATGTASDGKIYQNTKMDLSSIINSGAANTSDSMWFNNGEGRYVIDLQKPVAVDKINFYLDQFRERGNQTFSIWGSENSADISGDPKEKGFQYLGIFNGGRRGFGVGGTSVQFDTAPKLRYILFISDGGWHGKDFIKQVDVFTK